MNKSYSATVPRVEGTNVELREPGREHLRIDLHGDLAGILIISSQKRVRPGKTPNWGASRPNKIALVAGACYAMFRG